MHGKLSSERCARGGPGAGGGGGGQEKEGRVQASQTEGSKEAWQRHGAGAFAVSLGPLDSAARIILSAISTYSTWEYARITTAASSAELREAEATLLYLVYVDGLQIF